MLYLYLQAFHSHHELSQSINLSTTDLIIWLEICLNSTNYTFCGKHYKQVFGTAMRSPVSSVVANLVMEDVEKRALETFADLPRLLKRYVYDTFVITKKSKFCEFFTHLNTIESSNQYTKEQKKEEYLPFLDLLDQTLIKSPLSVSSLSQANPFRQIPQL